VSNPYLHTPLLRPAHPIINSTVRIQRTIEMNNCLKHHQQPGMLAAAIRHYHQWISIPR